MTVHSDLDGPVCLFDGACNLCNGSVRFILRYETAPRIRFAAVQSETGQRLLKPLGMASLPESFVFIEDGQPYLRSTAAFRVLRYLRAPWRWLRILTVLPRPVTDWLYDRVARNRYRLFGRRAVCLVPLPDQAERFLR